MTAMNQLVSFTNTSGQVRFVQRPGRQCWSVWNYPVQGYELQYWAKPLANGAAALLVINTNASHAQPARIDLSKIFGLSGKVKVRDVWAHADKGTASGALAATVPPYDSLFYVLTPAKN